MMLSIKKKHSYKSYKYHVLKICLKAFLQASESSLERISISRLTHHSSFPCTVAISFKDYLGENGFKKLKVKKK
jgi:hypothetical protein